MSKTEEHLAKYKKQLEDLVQQARMLEGAIQALETLLKSDGEDTDVQDV